jgi:hypothetical protein
MGPSIALERALKFKAPHLWWGHADLISRTNRSLPWA